MNNQTKILIEILKQYRGELSDNSIVKLTKIIGIVNEIMVRMNIPIETIQMKQEEEILREMIEGEITEENVYHFISQFFPQEHQLNEEEVKRMWREEASIQSLFQSIINIVTTPEVNKYISKKFMNKLTETAQYMFTQLIGCINESLQMEIEENEQQQKVEGMEEEPKENEVKTIPIEENKEDEVNEKFRERMKTIGIDREKIKRKYETFTRDCNAYGENVEYFMEKDRPMKEVENLMKRGIEVNELNMRIMIELDGYVGLNEENRQERKRIITEIQQQLDENEEYMRKVKRTQTIVEKKVEMIEQKKKQDNEMKQTQQMEQTEEMEHKKTEAKKKQKKRIEKKENNQRYVKPKEVKEEYEESEEQKEKLSEKSIGERIRDEINWNEMRINPQFNVNERGNTIIVTSRIPGMKQEDINVTVTRNGDLKITGMKQPTDIEMNMMIRSIKQRMGNINEEMMIRMIKQYSNGRFGTFTKIYELPENIDIENITMRYEDGILQVTLPQKPQRKSPNRYYQNVYPFSNPSFNPFGGFW